MADVWPIQWHVVPEPRIILQGAATWWIHCHDSRAACHIAGCKNSIHHTENRFSAIFFFYFLNAVRAVRSGGFRIVSDTLVLLMLRLKGQLVTQILYAMIPYIHLFVCLSVCLCVCSFVCSCVCRHSRVVAATKGVFIATQLNSTKLDSVNNSWLSL